MKKNIFVSDIATRSTFVNRHIGPIVITPNVIYFISNTKIKTLNNPRARGSRSKIGLITASAYAMGYKGGPSSFYDNELKEYIEQSGDITDVIQKLDRLVLEKKGSVKINKSEIKSFKIKSQFGSTMIRIKTENEKYNFAIPSVMQENKTHELMSYLNNNSYIR